MIVSDVEKKFYNIDVTSFSVDMETSRLPVNDNDVSTTQINDVDTADVSTTQNEEFGVGQNEVDNDDWQIGESESDLNVSSPVVAHWLNTCFIFTRSRVRVPVD